MSNKAQIDACTDNGERYKAANDPKSPFNKRNLLADYVDFVAVRPNVESHSLYFFAKSTNRLLQLHNRLKRKIMSRLSKAGCRLRERRSDRFMLGIGSRRPYHRTLPISLASNPTHPWERVRSTCLFSKP
jgi:hypothetical protein